MRRHWVVKKTFQPGLVPTIMAKASKCSASGNSQEGIIPTSNFDLEDDNEDMSIISSSNR